ncbi:MAG TPA: M12 family metallo-peptidase [Pyrinomonadaceae bacterium]
MKLTTILTVAALLLLSAYNGSINQPAQVDSPARPWQDVDRKTLPNARLREQYGPRSYRSLKLNVALLQAILRRAPLESLSSNQHETITLDLPVPDGSFMRFNIEDSPIMEKQLANRYPEIKTYRGQGIDDPTAITRFDWTPFGFHAIILSTRGTILVEPASSGDVVNYVAYFQDQLPGSFSCDVDTATQEAAIAEQEHFKQLRGIRPNVVSGSALRTYRLAVAATAEYTQTYGNGTVAGSLAAITTTMNLVNAIYQRELSIRMILIANEDSIIFTDTTTDGYTSDTVASLISENQTKLDSVISDSNYDIGHVFDGRTIQAGFFSFQGQASLQAVCRSGAKGRGASIFRSLQPFDVYAYYIVAHEMGHQFGATHTFNATTLTCGPQRAAATAYEPGTGSTIMGYRAACGAEDLGSTDTYFHVASLEQITDYTTVGSGTCAVSEATGNNLPTVDAGADYTIPSQTPFILTATASDPDGSNNLIYCWEEFDVGTASPPSTDDGTRPIFRSFAPVGSPARMFPRLTDILTGIPTFGESLPTTTRTMNFKVTVRDNRVTDGAVNSDGMQLNVVSGAGPFTVSQPSNSTNWPTNSSQTVTWNVANTDQAPVNCSNVKISLSIDGGFTFPITLANSTPNDGSETVTIPGTPGGNSRIKIEAVGNVFFNISQPFVISGVLPSFSVSGHVADAGNNPVPDATITLTKNFQGTITTTIVATNILGNYSSGELGCQNSVQVTPSKAGYSFSPLSISLTSSGCLSDTATANFTATLIPPIIFVEEGTSHLAAVDSVTFVRGPFALTNTHNFSSDQRTRIMFFTTDLGFSDIQPPVNILSVQIGGNSYPVEAVGSNSTTNGSYIVFRLPDLAPGTYPLGIRVRGVNSSNTPDLTIVPF